MALAMYNRRIMIFLEDGLLIFFLSLENGVIRKYILHCLKIAQCVMGY